jgi:hypothetical protein
VGDGLDVDLRPSRRRHQNPAVELRFPGIPITAIGYDQNGSQLTELKGIAAGYEIPANRMPGLTTATLKPGSTELEFEPIAYGNLRIEAPDGRVCEFPRAMARVRTKDGRVGLGWLEWGHNVDPASEPGAGAAGRARARAQQARALAEKAAMRGVARVPDAAFERLMNSQAGRHVVAAIFRVLPGRIDHRAAEGVDAIVRFKVRNRASGLLDVYDLVLPAERRPHVQRRRSNEVAPPDARITFMLTGSDLLGLATGRIDPVKAAVTRQILVDGDVQFMATIAPLFAKATSSAPAASSVVGGDT